MQYITEPYQCFTAWKKNQLQDMIRHYYVEALDSYMIVLLPDFQYVPTGSMLFPLVIQTMHALHQNNLEGKVYSFQSLNQCLFSVMVTRLPSAKRCIFYITLLFFWPHSKYLLDLVLALLSICFLWPLDLLILPQYFSWRIASLFYDTGVPC